MELGTERIIEQKWPRGLEHTLFK